MNLENERFQQLKVLILSLAEYYREPLTKNQVVMYAQDFLESGLTFEQISTSIKIYRRDVKNARFPLPAVLIEILKPSQPSAREVGVEVAQRIIRAIKRHGYTWNWADGYRPFLTFKEAFIAEVGDLAWEVVQLEGGWTAICTNEAEESTLHAQLRDKAASLYNKALNGKLHQLPTIPKSRLDSFKEDQDSLLMLTPPLPVSDVSSLDSTN